MNIEDKKIVYVLDANVLINFLLWHPPKFSVAFWSKIQELLENGRWILLDVVADEMRYDRDLSGWTKEQKKKNLIVRIDDEVRNRATEINNQYKMIDEVSGKSEADTYIIAYAEINSLAIFTREGLRKDKDGLYKIPDVCSRLGIEYTRRPKVFMNKMGFDA